MTDEKPAYRQVASPPSTLVAEQPCHYTWVGRTTRCGRPATMPVIVGCVHEHVRASRACPPHAESLALSPPICEPCYRSDGHACRVILLAKADADA